MVKIIKKILITNDDGYKAVGINLLKNILINYSQEVYMVAPYVNQSGAGRSITLGTQIKYNKISNSDWVVHGTPTDAIIFALNKILDYSLNDILADDATYFLAKIYDEKINDINLALLNYNIIIEKFQGSIYYDFSRKKIRSIQIKQNDNL
mgnify:CR=1 FL=1